MMRIPLIIVGIVVALLSVIGVAIISIIKAFSEVRNWMAWFTDKGRPGGM